MTTKNDLDAILDTALDDLDDDSTNSEGDSGGLARDAKPGPLAVDTEIPSPPKRDGNQADGATPKEALDTLLDSLIDEDQAHTTQDQASSSSGEPTNSPNSRRPSLSKDTIDQTVSNMFAEMAKLEGTPGDAEEDEILKAMLGQFESMGIGEDFEGAGGDFNVDSMVDGMMEQLLAKDLMYEPMKQVAEEFPKWLRDNKDSISEKEFEERCQQHELFEKIVKLYESDPNNTSELMDLMQRLQDFGQPPKEIVNKIAPGLDVDDEGVPNINPLEALGQDENCKTM